MAKDEEKKAIVEEATKLAKESIEAEQRAKNPQPGPEVQRAVEAARQPPKSPDAVRKSGEETVTMVFPRAVMLTLDDHSRVHFAAGIQEVPASLAEHRYLSRCGVKKYQR